MCSAATRSHDSNRIQFKVSTIIAGYISSKKNMQSNIIDHLFTLIWSSSQRALLGSLKSNHLRSALRRDGN